MTETNFLKNYWELFINIENYFIKTFKYVSLDEENFNTFSNEYIKLLLFICSEVDVIFKTILGEKNITLSKECMDEYTSKRTFIYQDFDNLLVKVAMKSLNYYIQPWKNYYLNNYLDWWKSYNKCKHERTSVVEIANVKKEAYKFANLKNVLLALASLYTLEIILYKEIKINCSPEKGLESKLFKLENADFANFIYSPIEIVTASPLEAASCWHG